MKHPGPRPPLPPPLSHEGIRFFTDIVDADLKAKQTRMSDDIIAAIAASLQTLLPAGDLSVNNIGEVVHQPSRTDYPSRESSLWYQAGLIAGIERNPI